MGWGDDIMATGEAQHLFETLRKRVRIVDEHDVPRMSDLWSGNPVIARPDEKGDFATLVNCKGHRAHILQHTPDRFIFNDTHRARRGRLYFTDGEEAFAQRRAGRVIVEPHVKARAPNKQWPWARWQRLVYLLASAGVQVTQLGPHGTRVLDAVEFIPTDSFRIAAAVLSKARAAILPEGALHHAAAACGVPAVVIFGGFISPKVTGYDGHWNIFTGGVACGNRRPCPHCASAMARIQPEQVMTAALELLEHRREATCNR